MNEFARGVTYGRIPEWLLDSGLSDRAKVLYAVLTRYADQWDLKAWPSRKTLGERCRCSADSIDRALKELVDAEAVEVQERYDPRGDRDTNRYVLIAESAAPLRTGGRTGAHTGGRGAAAAGTKPLGTEATIKEGPHSGGESKAAGSAGPNLTERCPTCKKLAFDCWCADPTAEVLSKAAAKAKIQAMRQRETG